MAKHLSALGALIFLLFTGCGQYENKNDELALARVHDKYLYPSDLTGIITPEYSPKDSTELVRNYIDKWIKREIMLQKAEENLSQEELLEITKQLQETRASLTTFKYQQQLIRQIIDTIVTLEEIQNYFEENEPDFMLDKNIVKALYIKLPAGTPNLNRVRVWYRSDDDQDLLELESYCYQYAINYDYFNEEWIYFDDIKKQLPSDIRNEDQFLRYNRQLEMEDSLFHYFVYVREFELKGNSAPIEFVENNIKSIIMNKRKIELINETENSIFMDAMNKNEFEIYE